MTLGNLASLRDARGEDVAALHEEAIALAEAIGDPAAEAAALGNLGSFHINRERPDVARPWLERSVAVARDAGLPVREVPAQTNLGEAYTALGRHEEARVALEAGRDLARETGMDAWATYATYHLARRARLAGDLATAGALMEEVWAEIPPDTPERPRYLCESGQIALAGGGDAASWLRRARQAAGTEIGNLRAIEELERALEALEEPP